MDYDVIVIGSGPGGYHAAVRAAQLGKKVACVENEYFGGVCLNVGCIPTKALLHVAEDLRSARHAEAYGVSFGEPEIDLKAVEKWKQGVVKKLTGGVEALLKGNKIDTLWGTGVFKDANTISVDGKNYTADNFIIATGSEPIEIPGFETNGETIVNSTGALMLQEVPARFMAIGGSAIGLEFSDIYNAFGSEATVVELMDHIVPTADADVAKELAKAFKKRGIQLKEGTKAVKQEASKDGIVVTLEKDGQQEVITVDRILVGVGRRPRSYDIGLESLGIHMERGYIQTNAHMQSNVPHIYAIGDVVGGAMLAHEAMKEGIVAAEHISGMPSAFDTVVPGVIYTSPELASVGLTEKAAKAQGFEVNVGKFPLSVSGRAMTLGVSEGIVKVVGDAETDLLLGFQMVGPSAGDMVSEAALALEMGATLEDIGTTQHAHPTIAESFMEAAEHAHGKAIHIANRRTRKS